MNTRDLANVLSRMPPGSSYRVPIRSLRMDAGRLLDNTYGFPLQDYVLEHIVGSSYEFGYTEDPMTGDVTYFRLKEPLNDGRLSYVSPDRRHLFRKSIDGTYELLTLEGAEHE